MLHGVHPFSLSLIRAERSKQEVTQMFILARRRKKVGVLSLGDGGDFSLYADVKMDG